MAALAQLTARYGLGALSHVPALRTGKLFTVDRSETESLRTLDALFRNYEATKVQKKPLSIGVFGPPGAGKSFGVKALTEANLGPKAPFLEFNLSQFKSPEELIGAFHRVRDEVLKGITPVAFWDEFDSQKYKWLQYLLAPMQDGSFQEGQITHPIGKCIFIFAGGTSPTLDEFGVKEPQTLDENALKKLSADERAERRKAYKEESDRFHEFKLLKGPDFISRLDGFLNVLGPNPRKDAACADITWPIRRALVLRSILNLPDNDELAIDPGLLYALLNAPDYRHGARSFEKIVKCLAQQHDRKRLHRSALPPVPLLDRETCAGDFHRILSERDVFLNPPTLDALAAVIHESFRKAGVASKTKSDPDREWKLDPSIQKAFDDLDPDMKASNRASARRVPGHLALVDYVVVPQEAKDDRQWKSAVSDVIEKHLDLLAMSEHLGWCAERIASGWTHGRKRDNERKRHPSLVPWAQLAPQDQDKDRASVLSIPEWLNHAKLKAVPASTVTGGAKDRAPQATRKRNQ